MTPKLIYAVIRLAMSFTAMLSRMTPKLIRDSHSVIQMVISSQILIDLWKRYQKKFSYAEDVSWDMVSNALKRLLQA